MKKILLIAALFCLCSCSTITIRNSDKMPPVRPSETISNRFFIGGIGQENIIEPNDTCEARGYTVKNYYSFLDGFIAVITFGIYTPSTTEIYCERAAK